MIVVVKWWCWDTQKIRLAEAQQSVAEEKVKEKDMTELEEVVGAGDDDVHVGGACVGAHVWAVNKLVVADMEFQDVFVQDNFADNFLRRADNCTHLAVQTHVDWHGDEHVDEYVGEHDDVGEHFGVEAAKKFVVEFVDDGVHVH